jgi:phage host-nuclease inhibitor protein Gam
MIMICRALLLALLPAAAFAATEANVELEEVIVHGRQLDVLRKEMIKAEEQFFDRYNEIVEKKEYQIHCTVEQPIGSRVPRRYCRTGYEQDALSQAGREAAQMMQGYLDELRRGVPSTQVVSSTSVSPASMDGKHKELQKVMLDKVTHDEALLKALVNHARLVDRYNTVYREKFGNREEK